MCMSFVDRLKKMSHQSGLVASAALAGTLIVGKIAPNQNATESAYTPTQTAVQPTDTYSETAFNQRYGRLFDISGTQQAVQGAKNAIWQMSRTPEGKKLLNDLSASQTPTKISFSEKMEATDYGSANQKKEGFPIELNAVLAKDNTKLTATLFHELCHVRQYQQGVGRPSDLPEHKYDLTIAKEAEARFLTAQMSSHLSAQPQSGASNAFWLDKSLALDGRVYDTVRNGLSARGLAPEQADKQAKEEVLKSMVSGKNTETVNTLLPERDRDQFNATNAEWLHTYNMVAAAHAYDEAYPTMTANGKRATELVSSISDRLGVSRDSLLSPTGTDLKDVQKDASGNILSANRIYRRTQENFGSVQCTYDSQNRPLSTTELNPDKSLKSGKTYTYGAGDLPIQTQENRPNSRTITDYAPDGTRLKEVSEDSIAKTTRYYEAGQLARETEQNAYGVAETLYKNGEKSDYVHKANDGTVIDEFHQTDIKPPTIPTADSFKSTATSTPTPFPIHRGAAR